MINSISLIDKGVFRYYVSSLSIFISCIFQGIWLFYPGCQAFWYKVVHNIPFSSVQSLSRVRLFVTPWIADARPRWPSPTPGVHSNSHPSSRWCHPAISSSVVPFSCPQSLTFPYYVFNVCRMLLITPPSILI